MIFRLFSAQKNSTVRHRRQPARAGRLSLVIPLLICCCSSGTERRVPAAYGPDDAAVVYLLWRGQRTALDQYEVSNRRFARFIAAGGYSNRRWWSEAGWQWRTSSGIRFPRWWESGRFQSGSGYPEYPVCGVSWFEAEAFARWAGKALPDFELLQFAAGSASWPWGGDPPDFAGLRYANFSGWRDGALYLAPVESYPSGRSRHGCLNLAGNVAEWTAAAQSAVSALCAGGSWDAVPGASWTGCAVPVEKTARLETVGFRCIRK